jgi:uncharacterized membrane protein YdbT with pleckstrin-like domain
MEYIKKLLSANEEILFKTRRHFFVIFGQIIKEILILIALGIAWFAIYQWAAPEYSTIFQLLIAAVATIVLISMFIDIVRWSRDSFYVTNRRVIQVSGVLNKKVLDSSLSKINDVILNQSWMGRIFNYGTIKIMTATEEVVNLLDRINNPMGFKRAMLDAKTVLEPVPVGPGVSSSSATQLLEELSQLKAKNMISDAEYEEKRKEILRRM